MINTPVDEDEDVYVVAFTTAGLIGAVTNIDKIYAQSTAKQLRGKYPSVRVYTRDEYVNVLTEDAAARKMIE